MKVLTLVQKNGTRIKTNNDYRLKNEYCNSLIILTVELSVVRYLILANGMISSAIRVCVCGGGGGHTSEFFKILKFARVRRKRGRKAVKVGATLRVLACPH